ncbi:MAG: S8 family serine peptidase [Actinomycetota bacterium]
MRPSRFVVALAGALLTTSSLVPAVGASEPEKSFYVIGFTELPRSLRAGERVHGARVQRIDRVLHFARVSTRNPDDFLARARRDDRVRYVEPDPEIKLIEAIPNDPRFAEQYGPQQVRAPEAWDTTLGSLDASVCVVDTGVRYTHEDIADARWLGGADFYNGDSDPMDDNGHGTHVAGIAAATINNATGIAGIANAGLYGVKVLSSGGIGAWSAVASGIRWCADNAGPRGVINLSLGGGGGATVLKDGVAYAYSKGSLLVAAAGNSGPCTDCVSYPAAYPEVIAVTCTTSSEVQCGFSSDGPESELAAPGQSILSLWHTGDAAYNTISGTSMSTPHVAGAAALAWSVATSLSNASLRDRLRTSARDLGDPGWDELYGYGLVDAKATLDAALTPPTRLSIENFDDGTADGWTLTGLWHVSSQCSAPPSAPNYLGYNEDFDCQYSTGSRTQGAATFDVDLTGRTEATLSFKHRFEKENYSGGDYDRMRVLVSTDGGSSWARLKQWDSRDPDQLSWTQESFDLTRFVGGIAKIRFFFDSVNSKNNDFAGWFLDDVEVSADGAQDNLAPVADAGADQTVADDDGSGDEAVTLDGSGSHDPDGTIASYEWREGDALLATGPTPTVTLPVGAHTITLIVTDDDEASASDTVTVTVEANRPPTASFTHTTSGTTVSVDGSASSDPDGTIASYSWDWGDGSPHDSGATASHTYASLGTYTITLTVVDNGGASASSSQTVTVGEGGAYFFEDFDDGSADGWELKGLWHVSSRCSAPPSAPNYLGYNEDSDCQYSTGSRTQGAATFDIDLTSKTAATLSFKHRFEKENYPGADYDRMRVLVSTDGGSSWARLRQWDSRDPDQLSWTQESFDLTRFVGGVAKIRFFFDSVNSKNNDFAGWFLDDVEVTLA